MPQRADVESDADIGAVDGLGGEQAAEVRRAGEAERVEALEPRADAPDREFQAGADVGQPGVLLLEIQAGSQTEVERLDLQIGLDREQPVEPAGGVGVEDALGVDLALVVDQLAHEGGHHHPLGGVDEAEERRRHDAVVEVAGVDAVGRALLGRVAEGVERVVEARELDLGRELRALQDDEAGRIGDDGRGVVGHGDEGAPHAQRAGARVVEVELEPAERLAVDQPLVAGARRDGATEDNHREQEAPPQSSHRHLPGGRRTPTPMLGGLPGLYGAASVGAAG